MAQHHFYSTVSESLVKLRSEGFTSDFNLQENCLVCQSGRFYADEFRIVDVYRYEGESDPADEATVYAIESNTGLKGVLVTGYGFSSDSFSTDILSKLAAPLE